MTGRNEFYKKKYDIYVKKKQTKKTKKQNKMYFNDQGCIVNTIVKTYDIISGINS